MGNLVSLDIDAITKQVTKTLKNFPQIAGAYLFGSALGACRPDSDIDIGLVPEDIRLSAKETAQLEAVIAGSFHPFEGHPYDIVLLNLGNPIFSFRIIKKGRLIYVRDLDRVQDVMEQVSRRYADVYPRYRIALDEILDEVVTGGNRP